MSIKKKDGHHELTRQELKQIVAEADTGGRKPSGIAAHLLVVTALAWSLFQLWIASPLPFSLGFFVLNDTESRSIHLAFAVFLAFSAYPAFKSSPCAYVPLIDWGLALVGAFCAGYLFLFYAEVSNRPGQPTAMDLVVAVAGLVLLLEAARRALGLPLVILAAIFIAYIFLGAYMPDVIAHKGASLGKGMSHLWLATEGVFGVALGVSAGFIFLFVLFGALLETAGAGNYFIKSAVSMLGHLRGGPAKAAVLASAATGMISGSSIANVVTTGTFTIPLMKRVGYRADKAAAVEVAASVDGQIMPPVMGAAAFLMVEYVGIPYTQVLKHALLPALISYIALFYIVHLEAVKANICGIPRPVPIPWMNQLTSFAMNAAGIVILAGIVYYGLGWLKGVFGEHSVVVIGILMASTYVALIRFSACYPELRMDAPGEAIECLPEAGPTLKSGLHFLLPVIVLIWNLMVEALSPALSAFWATLFLIFILVTQRPMFAFFRKQGRLGDATWQGLRDLFDGLVIGARNMIGVGIATAAAGIIVGTVTLTGIGLVMSELVETIAGGNLMIMLCLVAVICLILGMGLPTTANYIVVSTLMAPVIVELGAQQGLLVPLIAVHLFVFYFGLMADVTPPVGLASYAAAGIAKVEPMRVGITAFGYSIRTAILPFMFIFNTQLLMIDIGSVTQLLLTVASAILASLLCAAAIQGWFMTRNRLHESALLLLVAFALFRPGYFMDRLYDPFQHVSASGLLERVDAAPKNELLRVWIEGTSVEGKEISKGVLLDLGAPGPARQRLERFGLRLLPQGEDMSILMVNFGSRAERAGIEQGFVIKTIELPAERPAKEWIFLPALALLMLIVVLQLTRAAACERPAENERT